MYIMYAIDGEELKVNIDYVGKRNVFASVNEVSGGSVIVSSTGNSYYSHWSEIYCIRTA